MLFRSVVYFTVLVVGMTAAGLACEYMKDDSRLRWALGNTGAFAFIVVLVMALLVLTPVAKLATSRAMLRQRRVFVWAGIYFLHTPDILGGPGHEIVLRRDELRRVWIVSSSSGTKHEVSLPMSAFPTLDGFLMSQLPELKVV